MPVAGRPPKRRDDFMSEAQSLLNLARAIRDDNRRPEKWRRSIVENIVKLHAELLKAPEPT